jgi:iron complex transport system substrate-binding protein
VKGFPADFYSWAQPETRWILGIQWLARDLHPETFDQTSMREELFSFYRELYGLDAERIRSLILPRVEGALSD